MRKVKVSEFAEVITGGTPSTSVPEYWDNGTIPWLQSGSCQNCMITECNTFITQAGLDNSAAKMMKPDSVLIALTGATTGKVGYLTFEACANQSVTGIQPNDQFVPKYLYYYLLGIRQKILDDSYGGAQKHISQGYVKNLEIPLCTIDEQRRIVSIFERVDRIISDRQQELIKLDELIKARFVELFGDPVDNPKGWKIKKLKDLVSDDCNISYGIVQTGDDQEEGIPVFRPVDIVNHVPIRSELKKTTEEISNKYKRTLLKGREMLITVRANIADTYIVGEEFVGCNVGRGIVPIRTKEDEMILEFLKYQIDSKHLNDNIKALAKGITLIQLNMEDLREICLIVPPIEQQKAYVEFAKQVDKSKVA